MADQIKKYLDVILKDEDVAAIRLIILKKEMGQAALQRKEFDPDVKPEAMTAYYRAALDMYAEAQHDQNMWWKKMNEEYKLPLNGISLDLTIERFYSLEDGPEVKEKTDASQAK
jgi:hypothetical protein